MNIIVLLKAAPREPSEPTLKVRDGRVQASSPYLRLGDADEHALAKALALRSLTGGTVTAVTMGPYAAQEILYKAVAAGADRVVRVDAEPQSSDWTAHVLGQALRQLPFDVIIAGAESSDHMSGAVGGILAGSLGIPYCFGVVEITPGEGGRCLRVTKDLGGSARQVLEADLPVALSVQPVPGTLGTIPVALQLRAKRHRVDELTAASLKLADPTEPRFGAYTTVRAGRAEQRSSATTITGSSGDMAEQVLQVIREALKR